MLARFLHLAMIASLLLLIHCWPWAACGRGSRAVCALLIYEHTLVKANDLSRVDAALLHHDGWVSVLSLCFGPPDVSSAGSHSEFAAWY